MNTIPDHLIEKAARAFQRLMRPVGPPPVWEDTPAHIQDVLREGASAILDAVADDLRAEAWDEGHRTRRVREPDECECGAWSSNECGCGLYGTGRIVTTNPYRQETDR